MKTIAEFIALAQTLSTENIDMFVDCYAQDAEFTDPFQTVRGRQAIRLVYLEMLHQLHQPRFCNVRVIGVDLPQAEVARQARGEVMIGWDFEFALAASKPKISIAGCSLLRFDAHGSINEHRDYWDASRLMQAFPGIGQVIGWLRKKIGQSGRT